MVLRASLFAFAVASMLASPAVAQTSPAPAAPATSSSTTPAPATKGRDPNEMVCERQQELGSRLGGVKVCHTRAEWADLRHQDREMIDRAQTQLGNMGK